MVTFCLFLCVSEILSLLCSSTLVSPKFFHVPLGLGVGGWPLGYEEKSEGVGLIVGAIISKTSNLSGPDPHATSQSQTD